MLNERLPDDPYLTTEEFAELARVPVNTVYKWIQLGKAPPSFRPGKRLLWKYSEAVKWIEGHPAEREDDDGLINAREAAKLLGWPIEKLEKAMRDGTAPPYRVEGRKTIWSKTEVVLWKHSRWDAE